MPSNSSQPVRPTLPPSEGLPLPINVTGPVENLHMSFGTNAQTSSSSSVDQSVNQSFVKRMAAHGWGYWAFHFFLALLAAAVFEMLVWHFHLLGH